MTQVTFLGLGDIGAPIARHIAAHFPLTVWNRSAARRDAFARTSNAQMAQSPAEAVRSADIVVSCLSTSADVASVLAPALGVLDALRAGTIWVDCTSGDPTTSREIAAMLAKRGVSFLDAPVSGGTSGAQQGTLTVMCGGDAVVLERVRPVLETFAKKIVLCGPVGSGDAVKAVNNALLAVCTWSAAEGLATLTKLGVSPAVALEVINASSGRSNATETLIPQRVLTRAFPRTFRLALLDKDVAIAATVAREQRVPSPVLQQIAELTRAAHTVLGEEADAVEAVKLIEQWAGVEIAG